MEQKVIERVLAKYLPPNANFYLWIDRQKRPTIGATVHRGVGTNRQQVGELTFKSMLEVLTSMIQSLIPQQLEEVFLTFSTGSWQRTELFHLKAHLTTAAFFSLTDRLLSKEGSFLCIKDELENVKRKIIVRDSCEKCSVGSMHAQYSIVMGTCVLPQWIN